MPEQNTVSKEGLIVIGAGCMRTGTMSLKAALEILLGGTCYHMKEIFAGRQGDFKIWIEAAEKKQLTEEAAKKIFKDFNATTDFPAAHFYEDLMRIYPNAKVVLSVRDADRWAQSCKNTVLSQNTEIARFPFFAKMFMYLNGTYRLRTLMGLLMKEHLGIHGDVFQVKHEDLVAGFTRYNEKVKRTVPKDRLLVFQVSEGWGPLCEFLDVPIPDQPFPRVNDTAEFQGKVVQMKRGFMIAGFLINLLIAGGVAGIAYKLNAFEKIRNFF